MNVNYLQDYLEALRQSLLKIDVGESTINAPESPNTDPRGFGIALITVNGHVYQVGDSQLPFAIQSIAKAITYGIALEDNDAETVLCKVGVEPISEPFEPSSGRPCNPITNAGAIATAALIKGATKEARLDRLFKSYGRYLGHPVTSDEDVYCTEKSNGRADQALASQLHDSNIIDIESDEALELYYKQSSILVNCYDLALIGATLANNGINPITGECALESHCVPKVLSVISSCGMNDLSGEWIFKVGMPAISCVSGGLLAILPGQFGLAVFSPQLDNFNNSIRGILVCKTFSSGFGLHIFHTSRSSAASVIHATYDAAQVPSKRTRSNEQIRLLSELGRKVVVFEFQGELVFSTTEIMINEVMGAAEKAEYLILDLTRVVYVNEGAGRMLTSLFDLLSRQSKTVFLTGVKGKHETEKLLKIGAAIPLLHFDDTDEAIEWCEERSLLGQASNPTGQVPLAAQTFLAGFTAEEMKAFTSLLEYRTYGKGVFLCREGDPGDLVYFILSGQVSVIVSLAAQKTRRIITIPAGSAFGEMAMLDWGKRSADVVTDEKVTCQILDFNRLEADTSPLGMRIRMKLIKNVGRELTRKLRQATLEIKSLRS